MLQNQLVVILVGMKIMVVKIKEKDKLQDTPKISQIEDIVEDQGVMVTVKDLNMKEEIENQK